MSWLFWLDTNSQSQSLKHSEFDLDHMIYKMADEEEGHLLLKKLDANKVSTVLHQLIDGICKRGHPTYTDYSEVWTLQEWWAMVDKLENIIKDSVKETWTKDQILQSLNGLTDELKQNVIDAVNTRRDEIKNQLGAETCGISQAVLSDFDWQVKLVLSSDKISSIQEPILSLDLDVQDNQSKQTHSIELDQQELKKLITSLEGANKVVQQLKS